MMHRSRAPLLLALALVLAGCDRTFDEPRGAAIRVVSPDLGEALEQTALTLRLEASPQVTRLDAAGVEAVAEGGAFSVTLALGPGLNVLPLDGFGADGERIASDTAYVLVAAPRTTALPDPAGLEISGGLTATVLANGQVLAAGGERRLGGDLAQAVLFGVGTQQITPLAQIELQAARQGHSATLVPGREAVLLVGGARRRRPVDSAEFVDTAELVLPGAGVSLDVPISGGTVRRSGHAARAVTVGGTLYLYLVGGLVAGTPPVPARGVDVLRYEPDGEAGRLVVLSPPGGAGELPELPEPVLVGERPGVPAASLLFGIGRDGPEALRLTWAPPATPTYPVSLSVSETAPLASARTGAAGVDVGDDLAFVVGGRLPSGAALRSVEAAAPRAGRTFRLGTASGLATARSGHAATILPSGRILTLGGFGTDGAALLAPEITTL